MLSATIQAGVLLPETFLHTRFFVILATVVALNTVIYAALSLVHIFPKLFKPNWIRGHRNRRVTRSIFPDGPK